MNQTMSFLMFYFKMLLNDKITMIWTIILPIILALISYYPNGPSNYTILEKQTFIFSFWAFIASITYLNGVGMQISRIREEGLLKTFVMITGKKYPFILAIAISQCLLSMISILIFTIVFGFLLNILTISIIIKPVIFIIIVAPLSLFFIVLSYIPVKVDTLSTIVNMFTLLLFYVTNNTQNNFKGFEWLNPLYFFQQIAVNLLTFSNFINFISSIVPIIFYTLYVVIGIICMKHIDINSKTKR